MKRKTSLPTKFSTLTAAIAVLALSACSASSSDSSGDESVDTSAINANSTVKVDGEDLNGLELIDKIWEKNQGLQLPDTNMVTTGNLNLEVTQSGQTATLTGNLNLEYDADKTAFSADIDGKADAPSLSSDANNEASAKIFGEQDGSDFKVYGSYQNQWVQTTFTQSQLEQLMESYQNYTEQSDDVVPSETVGLVADVEATEDGDDLVLRIAPRDAIVNRIVSQSAGSDFEIDADSVKAFAKITVGKENLEFKSFAVSVEAKSTDGEDSINGQLSVNTDRDADVNVEIPDEAKNAQEFDSELLLEQVLGSSGSTGIGSTDDTATDQATSDDDPLGSETTTP